MKPVPLEVIMMKRIGELNAERVHNLNQIGGLQEDTARLKAEVERLTFDPLTYLDDQGEWMPRHTHLAAVARLKAEVERLTAYNEEAMAHIAKEERKSRERLEMAEAEVERLTKAGDNLERVLTSRFASYEAGNASHEWNAAKEGKQS